MPTLTLTMPDGDAEAYVAPAAGGAPAPGVLFIVDAIGLRPQIEQMADRIAADNAYIDRWSLGLDLMIAAKTLPLMLRDPNAY